MRTILRAFVVLMALMLLALPGLTVAQAFPSKPVRFMMAPAGTPRAVLDKIAADVGRVVANPEFSEKFIVGVGLESRYMGPDEFAQFINAYRDRFVARTKHLNIQLN